MYVTVTLRQKVGVRLSPASPSAVLSWWPTMSAPGLLSLFPQVLSSLRSSFESQGETVLLWIYRST